jgi:hypothetical protein
LTRYDIQVKDNKVAKLLHMHKQPLKMQFKLTLVDYTKYVVLPERYSARKIPLTNRLSLMVEPRKVVSVWLKSTLCPLADIGFIPPSPPAHQLAEPETTSLLLFLFGVNAGRCSQI